MRLNKLLTILPLAAAALLASAVPTLAARLHQPGEQVFDAYKVAFNASSLPHDGEANSIDSSREAAQAAADAVVITERRKGPPIRSPQANKAALAAARSALQQDPETWPTKGIKAAYMNAYEAAFKTLASEKAIKADPKMIHDLENRPSGIRDTEIHTAIRKETARVAKIMAASAVARAVRNQIDAEEAKDDTDSPDDEAEQPVRVLRKVRGEAPDAEVSEAERKADKAVVKINNEDSDNGASVAKTLNAKRKATPNTRAVAIRDNDDNLPDRKPDHPVRVLRKVRGEAPDVEVGKADRKTGKGVVKISKENSDDEGAAAESPKRRKIPNAKGVEIRNVDNKLAESKPDQTVSVLVKTEDKPRHAKIHNTRAKTRTASVKINEREDSGSEGVDAKRVNNAKSLNDAEGETTDAAESESGGEQG